MTGPTVLKIGGALVSRPEAVDALWRAVAQIRASRPVLLVHGGGPRATELARKLGHEPRIVEGRRVTGDLDLQIVKWTMRGELNADLVAASRTHGVDAVGISGADGSTIQVEKRPAWDVDGERVDFGWVGDIQQVDTRLLHHLLEGSFVPVVAPLGVDGAGRIYNVNADTVSCAIAVAVRAHEYLLVTESGGVRRNAEDAESHLSSISRAEYERGLSEGWIGDGMIVKLKVAFDAITRGIPQVYVTSPEGLLDRSLGTRVVA